MIVLNKLGYVFVFFFVYDFFKMLNVHQMRVYPIEYA